MGVTRSALLLYMLLTPGINSACPEWPSAGETFAYNGTCHHLIPTQVDWSQARDICAQKGWKLATTDTEDFETDMDLIASNFTNNYRMNCFWIGATDQVTEGEWSWTDGSSVANVKWDSHPFDFITGYFYDCAVVCRRIFTPTEWYIVQTSCSEEWGLLCQQDPHSITQPSLAKTNESEVDPPTTSQPTDAVPVTRKRVYTFKGIRHIHGTFSPRLRAPPHHTEQSKTLNDCTQRCAQDSECVLVNFFSLRYKCLIYYDEEDATRDTADNVIGWSVWIKE